MKAISLKQPFATWIRYGHKTIETRTWPTKHRGPLLICASAKPARCIDKHLHIHPIPAGCMICVVELVDCRPMTQADEYAAMCEWESGRWAWVIENVRPVKHVPVRGALGLYDVADELIVYEER